MAGLHKKKRLFTIICTVIILFAFILGFLFFTRVGQDLVYDIFGGHDLHLVQDEKELYWFDVAHRNSQNAPIFNKIEEAMIKFQPDLVLVEGGANGFEGSREEAIALGESNFATFLAKRDSIKVEDIEPSMKQQIDYLQTKYSVNEILAMYLIRQISSMQMSSDNSGWDFNERVLELANSLIDDGLKCEEYDMARILEIINTYLQENLDGSNWLKVDFKKLNYVYAHEGGCLNNIYSDVINYRNIHVVELVKEKKNTYNRIFIVMGGEHLIETRDELEEIY